MFTKCVNGNIKASAFSTCHWICVDVPVHVFVFKCYLSPHVVLHWSVKCDETICLSEGNEAL